MLGLVGESGELRVRASRGAPQRRIQPPTSSQLRDSRISAMTASWGVPDLRDEGIRVQGGMMGDDGDNAWLGINC